MTPMDIALTDELKQYLASVEMESVEGRKEILEECRDDDNFTSAFNSFPLADDASKDRILCHVDKLSDQVMELTMHCKKLHNEIEMLRNALRGEAKK